MNYIKIEGNIILLDDYNFILKESINRINFKMANSTYKEMISMTIYYNEDKKPFTPYSDEERKNALSKDTCVFKVSKEGNNIEFVWIEVNGKNVYVPENITSSTNWDVHYQLKKLYAEGKFTYSSYDVITVNFSNFDTKVGEQRIPVHSDRVESKGLIKENRKEAKEKIANDIIAFFNSTKKKSKTIVKD